MQNPSTGLIRPESDERPGFLIRSTGASRLVCYGESEIAFWVYYFEGFAGFGIVVFAGDLLCIEPMILI
jgi:hypothetical protein